MNSSCFTGGAKAQGQMLWKFIYSVCHKSLLFGGSQIPLNPPFSKGDSISNFYQCPPFLKGGRGDYRLPITEKTFGNCYKLVAQAFQPVSKKQVNRAQPGKAVPPAMSNRPLLTDTQGPSSFTEVSIRSRYLSILDKRVGREMPRSLAARLRLPAVRSRASLMIRLAK